MRLTLALHARLYSIHSFSPETPVPAEVFAQQMFFIGKTREELSVVVPSELELDSLEAETNWICLEVLGPLGFSMTGILSRISAILAENHISIFAISTFDTDYILVKKEKRELAVAALKKNGYQIIDHPQTAD
ncbi:ACT domain-containing protein [Shewanella sp. FJAT-52076]|uniref:ACT domain-containing protein n=1 Tax=Shewanella sp. FJAT-52076 TaxID=2864202 RepID=UPI001C65ED0B|nr:ACT domain-containing protein [Shewanella sp. FJAT-52076]QYJ76974.1 ACT domain-containing protein [Shewanella sp. FJAT-52076]